MSFPDRGWKAALVIRYPEANHENSVNELKDALIGPESVATIVESIHQTIKSAQHPPKSHQNVSSNRIHIPSAAKNVPSHKLPIVTNSLLVLGSSATGTYPASYSLLSCLACSSSASVSCSSHASPLLCRCSSGDRSSTGKGSTTWRSFPFDLLPDPDISLSRLCAMERSWLDMRLMEDEGRS